jgi:hypothetical protein
MFYRLPFPDLQMLEKLQGGLKITAAVVKFRVLVHADLSHARALDDLREGWVNYLETEIKPKGGVNPVRRSESIKNERNRTPTESEIGEMVCFHWYTRSVKCI